MSSSDSENDCYGNVALKLQKMKNSYKDHAAINLHETTEPNELENAIKKNKDIININKPKSPDISEKDTATRIPSPTIDDIIIANTTRRITRSNAASAPFDAIPPMATSSRRGARGGNSSSVNKTTPKGMSKVVPKKKTPKAQKTRAARGKRRRHMTDYFRLIGMLSAQNSDVDPPVFSIGNTSEYPDECHNQELFSSVPQKKNDVVVIEEENDPLDQDNEELSVKVYWQNREFFKFTIRQYQSLTQIFDHFVDMEKIERNKLLFTYNDRILKPTDTPDSIGYNIGKFIDGGVVKTSISYAVNAVSGSKNLNLDSVAIKFQFLHKKKPFETTVGLEEKLLLPMMKCSEHLEKPLEQLKFFFDGDCVTGKMTLKEFDFEGGECICIDVKY